MIFRLRFSFSMIVIISNILILVWDSKRKLLLHKSSLKIDASHTSRFGNIISGFEFVPQYLVVSIKHDENGENVKYVDHKSTILVSYVCKS